MTELGLILKTSDTNKYYNIKSVSKQFVENIKSAYNNLQFLKEAICNLSKSL